MSIQNETGSEYEKAFQVAFLLFYSLASTVLFSAIYQLIRFIVRENFFKAQCGSRKRFESDKKERERWLKRRFHPRNVPENLDVVVIGSGMGGLTCAALLAKAGRKVLVLEQHDQIGGCTHAYQNKGFEFDVGIHYIGDMEPGSMSRVLIDFLTGGQLEWSPMLDKYDLAVFENQGRSESYEMCIGRNRYMKSLLSQFPGEESAVKKFFEFMDRAEKATAIFTIVRMIPRFLLRILHFLKLDRLMFHDYIYLSNKTLAEVLDEVTDNVKLKAVLAYSFGTYATYPSETSFIMHALIFNHYVPKGGFYPVGGSGEIAYQMIGTIESSGGAVMCGAAVKQILTDGRKVYGVEMDKFCNYKIDASVVISSAGLKNTVYKLLPSACNHSMRRLADRWKVGQACFQVFVGLNGTASELGLPAKNFWLYPDYNIESYMKDYLAKPPQDAADNDLPLVFFAFPSAKDPSWERRFPGKSTCTVVTFTNYDWFAAWRDEPCQRRGVDYEQLKDALAARAWSQVLRRFPQLADKVAHFEAGTPLTHNHYIASRRGEAYGLDHCRDRFSIESALDLRPETPIRGLYLTGQDVFVCGFIGAAMGGLLTASSVLQRYLVIDLLRALPRNKKRV